MPYWLAVVVSTLAMAGSVLLAELWLARHADATDAAAAVVHFWLDAICAFFVCVSSGGGAGPRCRWRCR